MTELRASGITFDAHEAVAITQQLIGSLLDHDGADEVEPPYGPPSVDNVFLQEDGSVVFRGCRATPVVSEVARFLESLLPDGGPRVPGALRYTIARGRLEVDVRPFDSLRDFARDLVRHERGARAHVVRDVLVRAGAPAVSTALSLIDRRRPHASVTELRRALREAQARVFEQQRSASLQTIDAGPVRGRSLCGVAACFAAGLALMCAGEFMHRRQAPVAFAPAAPIVAQAAAADLAHQPAAAAELPPGIIAVRAVPPAPTRMQPRRVPVKRAAARPAEIAVRREARPRHASRGVLDRLRLGWLRSAFIVHSDL